jgi:hypothetical protein
MGNFSVKGMDVTIGDWHWDGFAAARTDSPLANKRRLTLVGGPTWDRDEAVDEDWADTVLPVSHIVRRGIEGGNLARRYADGAMWNAVRGTFREMHRLPTIGELREDPRDPVLAVELHELRVEFTWSDGNRLTVGGRDTMPRFGGDGATPNMLAAARFAHRLAWRETYAALLDASARIGEHVPSLEVSLEAVAGYAW